MIELIGFFFIILLGTVSHFFYEWFGHKKIFALFCAVNESTWEHIKLAIGPTFLWILIEIPFIGNNPNFLFAKFIALITMILLIPLFFYLYKLIFKKELLIFDIGEFIISIGLGQYFSYLILNSEQVTYFVSYLSLLFIIIIFISYLTLTLLPQKNFLFKDPITTKYGIKAHEEYDKMKKK